MVKTDTLLLLGAGAAAVYFLGKELKQVGAGVGEAVQGLGGGISTIGREAGDIVVDIGSGLEIPATLFTGTSEILQTLFDIQKKVLQREAEQSEQRDVRAESLAQESRAQSQAEREIFGERQRTLRSESRQQFLTNIQRIFTGEADIVLFGKDIQIGKFGKGSQIGKPLAERTPVILGGLSAEFSRALRRDKLIALETEPIDAGELELPSAVTGGAIRETIEGGGSAVRKVLTTSPTITAVKTLTQIAKTSAQSAIERAKGLLSSLVRRFRRK